MLIKKVVLDRIVAGDVERIFRRWTRPTVKTGGTLMTAVGELAIQEVAVVKEHSLTLKDAHKAGYGSLDELLESLNTGRSGDLYRIDLRYAGPDPRTALADNDDLADGDCRAILDRLREIDRRASTDDLCVKTLELISERPERRAQELADLLGMDKAAFKARVRKLKGLGLTESRATGYILSKRGRRLLHFLHDCGQVG